MTFGLTNSGAYLSDDTEGRLRRLMGEPCQHCAHLVVRESLFTEGVVRDCRAAQGNEVLARMLLRLAESGRCDEAQPFAVLAIKGVETRKQEGSST